MDTFAADTLDIVSAQTGFTYLFLLDPVHQMTGANQLRVMGGINNTNRRIHVPAVYLNSNKDGRRQLEIKIINMNNIGTKCI